MKRRGNRRTSGLTLGARTPSRGAVLQDLYVYQSESPEFYEFDQPDTLLWKETGIVYGDWTVARSRSVTVPLSEVGGGPAPRPAETMRPLTVGTRRRASACAGPPQSVQHNGTLYLHAYAVKQGHSPNELDDNFKTDALTEAHFALTKYRPRRKEKVLHNLLAGDAEPATQQTATAAATPAGEIVAYIHPNVSIALVTDQMAFPHNQYPAPNVNRALGGAHDGARVLLLPLTRRPPLSSTHAWIRDHAG